MTTYELAALTAAALWAVNGLISSDVASQLGAFGFNRLRQWLTATMLGMIVLATGAWETVAIDDAVQLVLSGWVGIFLGDTLLYVAMLRLGPRRTGALFAMNAPFAALLGWPILGESLSLMAIGGILTTTFGVALAVLGRPGKSGTHRFEAVHGPRGVAIGVALLSALGQACGSLIARPAMAGGIDPFAASLIRVSAAAFALTLLMALPLKAFRPKTAITPRLIVVTSVSGLLAMVLGMTALLYALEGGKVGIVSTLSAMTPVMVLPLLWIVTGDRPSATSWIGAALAVIGMGLIFAS